MDYFDRMRLHLEESWGPPLRAIDWAEGLRDVLDPKFRVWVFRWPHDDVLAYVTVGMANGSDAGGIELFLLVREVDDDRTLAELLFATAHYHVTGHPLALSLSVNFGRPWLKQSQCTRGLVSLPYLDGPKLERPIGLPVRVLWLLPVTESELAFRREHGLEALEKLFEETRFDYLDPLRKAVA